MKTTIIRNKFLRLAFPSNETIPSITFKGISPSVFFDFAETIKMPEEQLAGILHVRTNDIRNALYNHKSISPLPAEHLLKLIRLYAEGEELLGNIQEFGSWLETFLFSIDVRPIDLLITPKGVDLTFDELIKLNTASLCD